MGYRACVNSIKCLLKKRKTRKKSGAQRESNNSDEIKSHCVISTSSAHSIKALQEQRFEQCVSSRLNSFQIKYQT